MSGRILVVDDIATNRLVLKAKLAASYFEVIEADCGQAAIDIARAEHPDVILLDVMMPDMDGFTVCETLKSCPETSHIPIVMVTATLSSDDRMSGLEVGADDFLIKPIDDLALFARVKNLMRVKMMFDELRLRDATSREMGITDFLDSMTREDDNKSSVILAPPDAKTGQEWCKAIDPNLNVDILTTDSEHEVLNLAALEHPDAYIVHQNLIGGGEGLRLVSTLRARLDTRQSAIVFVVADGTMETAARALDLGASDYIVEPFDPNELVVRLRSQLRRKLFSDQLRSNMRDGLRMAVIDPLTGLYNRRYAAQHMNKIVDRAKAENGEFSVLMMDLDKFKTINDKHGHDAGDYVLKEFARRLQENIRGVDLVARIGGEEFLIVMPDAGRMVATHVSERLRRAVESKPFVIDNGDKLDITVSIGVALGAADDCDIDDLMKRADEALYKAKSNGRNLVSFYASAA